MHKRIGDTLVEVALAIGIFSMVAIAIVAVVNNSSAGAQSALENTVTREQIDSQAEALRFIHNSYIADVKTDQGATASENKYTTLWRAITNRAIEEDRLAELGVDLSPRSCNELYSNGRLQNQGAFIINTRKLAGNSSVSEVVVTPSNINGDNNKPFYTTNTYPRLVYGTDIGATSLLEDSRSNTTTLSKVEGLYIIPVKDSDSTTIVTSETIEHGSAYFDFYIMSCWFASNAERPSTISTVVRLYDPDVVTESAQDHNMKISFNGNGASSGKMSIQKVPFGTSTNLNANKFSRYGYTFVGWSTNRSAKPEEIMYQDRAGYQAPSYNDLITNGNKYSDYLTLYAIWKPIPYDITFIFDSNGGSGTKANQVIHNAVVNQKITIDSSNPFSRNRHYFAGWQDIDTGVIYNADNQYIYTAPEYVQGGLTIHLQVYWEPIYMIFYNTDSTWTVPAQECSRYTGCTLSSERPTSSGYKFIGWCTIPANNGNCGGISYQPGANFPASALASMDTNLYAIWSIFNDTITVKATWNRGRNNGSDLYPDFDTYVYGQKSNGVTFTASYSNKIGSDLDGTTIAQLDHDCISSCGDETFVINTLGGKNYYYYVYNRSGSFATNGLQVVISSPELGTRTLASKDASGTLTGTYNYWNVFAYIDGRLIIKNTITSRPDTSYRN